MKKMLILCMLCALCVAGAQAQSACRPSVQITDSMMKKVEAEHPGVVERLLAYNDRLTQSFEVEDSLRTELQYVAWRRDSLSCQVETLVASLKPLNEGKSPNKKAAIKNVEESVKRLNSLSTNLSDHEVALNSAIVNEEILRSGIYYMGQYFIRKLVGPYFDGLASKLCTNGFFYYIEDPKGKGTEVILFYMNGKPKPKLKKQG